MPSSVHTCDSTSRESIYVPFFNVFFVMSGTVIITLPCHVPICTSNVESNVISDFGASNLPTVYTVFFVALMVVGDGPIPEPDFALRTFCKWSYACQPDSMSIERRTITVSPAFTENCCLSRANFACSFKPD